MTAPPQGRSVAAGPFNDDLNLHVAVQNDRYDLTFTATGDIQSPLLGDFDPEVALAAGQPEFLRLCEGEQVTRLSVLCQLRERHPDIESSRVALRAMLPDLPFPPGASEVSYNLNRARPLQSVPGRMMNRIGRWSTTFQEVMRLQKVAGFEPHVDVRTRDFHFELALDINTSPSVEPFVAEDIPRVVAELINETRSLIYRSNALLDV